MSGSASAGAETQVMVASTVYGLATLAAALDEGHFPAAARRILVLSLNGANPETAVPLHSVQGFEQLTGRYDAVYSYNDAVAPQHPSEWQPRPADVSLWSRHFRQLWQLPESDRLRLVVESIHVRPAAALCAIFYDAEIEVYADGLMSYGPTRNPLPAQVATRVARLLHLDLVPGLQPLLLTEWQVPPVVIGQAAFRAVLAEISGDALVPEVTEPVTVLLGQYLAALGILTPAEEVELHCDMLRGLAALGHRSVLFKPHPTAGRTLSAALTEEADRLGVVLAVWEPPLLAETLYERLPVRLVVGCFSTAMLTAASCYGLAVARVGTELLLERLHPYQNSNRVPVTLVDALLPELRPDGRLDDEHPVGVRDLPELVAAVGYAMQPTRYPALRDRAKAFLETGYPEAKRYFKRRRLTRLALPGSLPAPPGKQRPIRRHLPRQVRVRARQLFRSHQGQ